MFVYRRLLYGNIFSMEIAILLLITLLPYVAMFDLFVGLLQSVAAQIGPLVPMAHHRKCSSLLGPAANKPDLIACDGQRQVDQGWVNTHGMMSSFGKTAWLTHFFPWRCEIPIGIIGYSMESYPFYSVNGNRESQLGSSLMSWLWTSLKTISLGKRASSIFTFSCFGDIWLCPAMECTQHWHHCISMDLMG